MDVEVEDGDVVVDRGEEVDLWQISFRINTYDEASHSHHRIHCSHPFRSEGT